jgi:hypothetical protein
MQDILSICRKWQNFKESFPSKRPPTNVGSRSSKLSFLAMNNFAVKYVDFVGSIPEIIIFRVNRP